MSDDEKSIDNKTIIKIIIAIVIVLGVRFSNYGKIKSIAYITAVICAILAALHFHQETCSNYQCPDGYINDVSKKDTECGGIADFTCDSDDKDTCCLQKCSKYTCPTGYQGKDNSDKINCKGSVCKETDDKDTCCNKSVNCGGNWSDFGECSVECGGGTQTRTYTITTQPQYGGTPCPTSPDPRPCNTQACGPNQDGGANDEDVVANATCSTVPVNCPDGYLYKTDSAAAECSGPTCDVEIGGVDLNNCCEQGCTSPGSIPTGYTGNLPAILPVGVGDITGVSCADNYHGTPQSNCNTPGGEYTLDGCDPYMCTQPSDITGYNITNVTSLERHNFSVDVECVDGYGSSTTAVAQAQVCRQRFVEPYDGEPYSLTGCENKTGFCSGNDISNEFECPRGYNLKTDSDTIVGNTLETCCDQIIPPPEAQTSEPQGTDLPICDAIKLTDKVASVMRDEIIEDITLEECITHCRDNDNCNSFSYKAGTSHSDTLRGIGDCYIYYQSNISRQFNTQYDYYPVKCQP